MYGKRDKNGRFTKASEDVCFDEAKKIGFKEDLDFCGSLTYLFWRLIPFLILAWIIWRYFKISKILANFIIEVACGEGCTCICGSLDPAPSLLERLHQAFK
jgi:hypothetical protein